MNFFYIKKFEIGYVLYLAVLRYRLTDIIKSTKFYFLFMGHFMSSHTPILPNISDFAEIWLFVGLNEKMSHTKFQVSNLNSF